MKLNAYNECLLCETRIDSRAARSEGTKLFLVLWAVFGLFLALLVLGAL